MIIFCGGGSGKREAIVVEWRGRGSLSVCQLSMRCIPGAVRSRHNYGELDAKATAAPT